MKARRVKDQVDNQFTLGAPYPGLQPFSTPFDLLRSGTWQGKEICAMIRTPADNCAAILVYSKYDRNIVEEKVFNEMVMAAVWLLCEFSLHVSQQNHSDLSLKALDNACKPFYQNTGICQAQKIRTLQGLGRRPVGNGVASVTRTKVS